MCHTVLYLNTQNICMMYIIVCVYTHVSVLFRKKYARRIICCNHQTLTTMRLLSENLWHFQYSKIEWNHVACYHKLKGLRKDAHLIRTVRNTRGIEGDTCCLHVMQFCVNRVPLYELLPRPSAYVHTCICRYVFYLTQPKICMHFSLAYICTCACVYSMYT